MALQFLASPQGGTYEVIDEAGSLVSIVASTPAELGAGGYVIWRPGVPSSGHAVATPDEVQASIDAGAVRVLVDSSVADAVLPAGFILDCGGVVSIEGYDQAALLSTVLTIADTGLVRDCPRITGNLEVACTCRTSGAFDWTATAAALLVDNGAIVGHATGATVPAYAVGDGQTLLIRGATSELDGLTADGSPALFSTLTGGGFVALLDMTEVNSTAFGCAVGGTLGITYTGTGVVAQTYPNALGTFSLAPALTFQAGNTAGRPTSPVIGQPYFDTSLATGSGKPIWWNGTEWVDATGTAA